MGRAAGRPPGWVYPRWRGGTSVISQLRPRSPGLSPLARGNPRPNPSFRSYGRSIPAGAGEPVGPGAGPQGQRVYPRWRGGTRWGNSWTATVSRSIPAGAGEPRGCRPRVRAAGVYPRWRGGTTGLPAAGSGSRGLSPLARGNRGHCQLGVGWIGSIPAGAGEPPGGGHGQHHQKVYPRWRGGTSWLKSSVALQSGLSPLARGNHLRRPAVGVGLRSIPAGAGEPSSIQSLQACGQVYPRWRGGNPLGHLFNTISHGSIPAGAGEPNPLRQSSGQAAVYPRWRGGTVTRTNAVSEGQGLSPLARGNPHAVRKYGLEQRSIPAGAGEPAHAANPSNTQAVYPRWRGGTSVCTLTLVPGAGLSPLARGNRRRFAGRGCRAGSIPAGAGEPGIDAPQNGIDEVYPRWRGGT